MKTMTAWEKASKSFELGKESGKACREEVAYSAGCCGVPYGEAVEVVCKRQFPIEAQHSEEPSKLFFEPFRDGFVSALADDIREDKERERIRAAVVEIETLLCEPKVAYRVEKAEFLKLVEEHELFGFAFAARAERLVEAERFAQVTEEVIEAWQRRAVAQKTLHGFSGEVAAIRIRIRDGFIQKALEANEYAAPQVKKMVACWEARSDARAVSERSPFFKKLAEKLNALMDLKHSIGEDFWTNFPVEKMSRFKAYNANKGGTSEKAAS